MFENELDDFQNRVAGMPAQFDKRAVNAINATARKAKNVSAKRHSKAGQPYPSYINQHLKILSPATNSKLEAVVGATVRGVLLNRFDAQQITTDVKHTGRSKGDARRGIRPGKKSRGVTVQVKKRGSKKFIPAFYLPLKNGNGINGMALAVRTGKGKKSIKVLHGPSVSQVFQTVKEDINPDVQEMVVNALLDELELL